MIKTEQSLQGKNKNKKTTTTTKPNNPQTTFYLNSAMDSL